MIPATWSTATPVWCPSGAVVDTIMSPNPQGASFSSAWMHLGNEYKMRFEQRWNSSPQSRTLQPRSRAIVVSRSSWCLTCRRVETCVGLVRIRRGLWRVSSRGSGLACNFKILFHSLTSTTSTLPQRSFLRCCCRRISTAHHFASQPSTLLQMQTTREKQNSHHHLL